MKTKFLILTATLLIFACGGQKNENTRTEKKNEIVASVNKQFDTLTVSKGTNQNDNAVIERYFPEEKETEEFDTIISAQNVEISIKSRTLDSYVTNEYEIEGIKHIDKYRGSEKHLFIKKSNEVLIDTIFKKSNFTEMTGEDFLKIADFHGYWFNKIENDTIELFGVISKPETDWSIAFYHYFDLKTKTFKIEEHIDEEI